MNIKDSFHPYAAITILFWSLAYVFTRLALTYFSAFSLGFLRYLIASCTLLIIALMMRLRPPKKADLPWFAAAGAAGFFLYMIAFNVGCMTVTASTSSVMIATVPIITALLSRFIVQERLSWFQWVSIAICFAGVIVITVLHGGFSGDIGLLWLIGAAFCLSVYNLLQRKLTKIYSSLQTSSFSIFAGTILLAVFLPQSVRELHGVPPVQIFYLIILGVFSSAIAYVAWAKAFAKAEKTSSVSNYMFITPFLTSLLGCIIAKEPIDGSTVIGGIIILFGLFCFNSERFIINHIRKISTITK